MTHTEKLQLRWCAPVIRDEAVRPARTSPLYEGPEYLSETFFRLAEWTELAALPLLPLQDYDPDRERDEEGFSAEELLKLLTGVG
ncbi:MAG: hypothetical protein HY320_13380 [Armatimonadetes bacterium]|nr:hypothetical protein [Armatimonadota bacterium]